MITYLNVLERFRPDGETSLLPGLQDLTCHFLNGVSDATLPVAALSHPGLLSLKINYRSGVPNAPSFDFLRYKAPMLRKLEVNCYPTSILPTLKLRSLLSSLHNLNYLVTFLHSDTPLPSATLLYLAKLPNLKIMTACIRARSVVLLPSSQDCGLFRALESLTLMGGDGEDIMHVLEGISSPNLTILRLKLKAIPSCSLVARWVLSIANHRALERFILHYHEIPGSQTPSHYTVTDQALQPLLGLPGLRRLCLPHTPLQLGNNFIHDLALLCPYLEELVLGSRVRWRTAGLTMEGLKPLSLYSSRLYVLAITMVTPSAPEQADQRDTATSASRWRWPNSLRREQNAPILHDSGYAVTAEQVPEVKCTMLRHIDIGNSTVADPVTFAAFICRHFPNVREISDLVDFGYHARLEKLNNLIKKWGRYQSPSDVATTFNSWDTHAMLYAVAASF